MIIFLTILHYVVCLFLIIVVLLQSGKAADLAGAFGGMGSQTAFGPRGAATMLTRATTTAAVMFMMTSISLGIMEGLSQGAGRSVIERTGTTETEGGVAPTPAPPTGGLQDIVIPPPQTTGAGADASGGDPLEATSVEITPLPPANE